MAGVLVVLGVLSLVLDVKSFVGAESVAVPNSL